MMKRRMADQEAESEAMRSVYAGRATGDAGSADQTAELIRLTAEVTRLQQERAAMITQANENDLKTAAIEECMAKEKETREEVEGERKQPAATAVVGV